MDVQVLQAVDAAERAEEELRKEIKEAFDHIREIGRDDGKAMRNKINDELIY